ncbi:MAG: chromosome segregation protein SMC [Pirellulaceae bacterium]
MLTSLELYGFKSFPDRTRFEFPPGITVIVGPNGSGKSNIVDAIKWVLGEQSAKSLRGKEMADVIFKGTTGTGGRRPANTAEATIFLDNHQRRLRLDTDEVRLTRRVYRSGEGEYLINGEPCRLKDIRNLIRGTGFGTDAYSLIEQGKVDQLLQASPRERRAIFEEAAGISRFKAKKVEAERRLSRVEQNLVRLADIVEEVGSRYRKIQKQATKASRYKELTERLKELRTHVGAKDWRDLTAHLEKIASDKASLTKQSTELTEQVGKLEKQSQEHDVQLSDWSSRILEFQQNINELIKQITERQSNIALHQSRTDDLKVQETGQREGLSRGDQRLASLLQRIQQADESVTQTSTTCEQSQEALAKTETEIARCQGELAELRADAEKQGERQDAITLLITELGKQLSGADSRLAMSSATRMKLGQKLQALDETITDTTQQHQQHLDQIQRLQNEAGEKDNALQQARSTLEETQQRLEEAKKKLGEKRRAQTGATQRADVIQELENRLEGVDSGVKELLERSRRDTDPWLRDVVGLVADVIKVNVQHAELVDLALGDFARCLIVDGDDLVAKIVSGELKPSGRVRLIQLKNAPTLGARLDIDLSHEAGVIGRLDRLVQAESEFTELVRRLLGGTWLVKTLDIALQLHRKRPGSVRLVTLEGDVIEADGTLVAGPSAASAGIVSRRSELRALHREIHKLTGEIRDDSATIEELHQDAKQLDSRVQELLGENTEIAGQLNEQQAQAGSQQQRLESARRERDEMTAEAGELDTQIQSLQAAIQADRTGLTENKSSLANLAAALNTGKSRQTDLQSALNELQQRQTTLKVRLAKSQQQHEDATSSQQELARQKRECRESIQSTRDSLAQMLWQTRISRREIDESSGLLSGLESQRVDLDSQLKHLSDQRTAADDARRELAKQLHQIRDQLRHSKDRLHQIELQEGQLSMERTQLAQRLSDDYEIDVAELDASQHEVDEDRDAIDKEISQLRRSIGNIGSVNMDALVELEEMQERYESLDAQYQDLVSSREALEKIIQKINNDSRRLFQETLEAIRVNFQKLFRQTFGGGRADLVLEEDVDILEAGIDIVATPPGKPEFNNSLLSGGERALTAVSLLMAIFQFRPSPFCVLDEVDAPFDEANIGRFIEVLKSFLGWTKFVIVTHSKVTMTAATTLYGVTMQESGVSKRVSVRFEDVNEEGEISDEAIKRDSGDEKVA